MISDINQKPKEIQGPLYFRNTCTFFSRLYQTIGCCYQLHPLYARRAISRGTKLHQEGILLEPGPQRVNTPIGALQSLFGKDHQNFRDAQDFFGASFCEANQAHTSRKSTSENPPSLVLSSKYRGAVNRCFITCKPALKPLHSCYETHFFLLAKKRKQTCCWLLKTASKLKKLYKWLKNY